MNIRRLICRALTKNYPLLSWSPALKCKFGHQVKNKKVETDGRASLKSQRRREALVFWMNMDEKMRKKRQRIQQELELFRAWNNDLPQYVRMEDWHILLKDYELESARQDYYKHMANRETYFSQKKEKLNEGKNFKSDTDASDAYDMCEHNSIFHLEGSESSEDGKLSHLWKNRIESVHRPRGVRSLVHGNPVIFDLDLEMNPLAEKKAFWNIHDCHKINVHQVEPMHMIVTGLRQKRLFKEKVEFFDSALFADFYEESFLELFDKSQLVYLVPNGPCVNEFKRNKVYIIGAQTQFQNMPQTSFIKAKEHGIEFGSLPFKRYRGSVPFGYVPGATEMFRVLLDLNLNGSFHHALPRARWSKFYN